jgi:Tfp pilus assembly protein PilV
MKIRARRSRGTTLIEILISLTVVLIGMLALFKTLATSVTGSMTASRLSQAEQRAVLVNEAIRVAPKAALLCLEQNESTAWDTCEATCKANLTSSLATKAEACIFKNFDATDGCSSCTVKLDKDKTNQLYYLVTKNDKGPVSKVTRWGKVNGVHETQIVIGWRDDNSTDTSKTPDHFITMRSGVFQP